MHLTFVLLQAAALGGSPIGPDSHPSATAYSRLPQLAARNLTPVQRAATGLHLYRQEMLHPTPPATKSSKIALTHDFVLSSITRKLVAVNADVPYLRKTWKDLAPGEVRDCLTFFLAVKGTRKDQEEVREAVVKYVTDGKHPVRLRELGTEALGTLTLKLEEPKLADSLAQVLREDSSGVYEVKPISSEKPSVRPKGNAKARGGKAKPMPARPRSERTVLTYPVRRAAVTAIRRLEKSGMLLPSYVTVAAKGAVLEVMVLTEGRSAVGSP